MAASSVYPQTFPEIVAIAQTSEPIGQIVQKFQPYVNYGLRLVDAQSRPIGVIGLPQLLDYLLQQSPPEVQLQTHYPSIIAPLPPIVQPLHHAATQSEHLATQNANLTQLNRLKDEFLACVTHELRSPLTAILGLSTLLKDQSLGTLNPQQLRYAHLIYNSGRHLISIVNDMLDLTRIETNQLSLNLGPVNISQVCLSAFEQARQLRHIEDRHTIQAPSAATTAHPAQLRKSVDLEATNLPAFNLEIEPQLESLIADEARLCQMLVNLLSNAMKFTENSGSIGLQVSHWEGWVGFTVWDTGIGIPIEKQHLLFQKFQQVESPMTRQFEGTGLGLVLTQRLARLHGGDVTFTSQEHNGSQFTLLLPPHPPQWGAAAPIDPIAAPPPSSQRSALPDRPTTAREPNRLALIAEASPHNLDDLRGHLTELGYRVTVARSGPEALAKARQLTPNVIFLNPILPVLGGWDVLTLLKANAATQEIPTIVTGPLDDQAQAQQADAFITWPIVHRTLADTLTGLEQSIVPSPLPQPKPSVVLYLSSTETDFTQAHHRQLNQLLHQHNFRVIECHDIEQADLLAQVWRARVVVLQPPLSEPLEYLQTYLQYAYLASLPLITLDKVTTQAANQLPSLAVFPCFGAWPDRRTAPNTTGLTSKLLQAVEVAIHFAGQPLILATDIEQWQPQATITRRDWLNATAQYIQAAGLRCSIGQSAAEIMQVLNSDNVDLLLLHWPDEQISLRPTLKALKTLQKSMQHLPAIVLIRTSQQPTKLTAATQRQLDTLNIQIAMVQDSMDDLLQHIRQTIGVAR